MVVDKDIEGLVPLHVDAIPEAEQIGPGVVAPPASRVATCCPEWPPEREVGAPEGLWRRALWDLSVRWRRLVSGRRRRAAEQAAVLRRPVPRPWSVAFVSMKGGVGKTTTCAGVGHVLAAARGDLVIAVDCNPDGGVLAQRVVGDEPRHSISDLLAGRPVEQYTDLQPYVGQAASRLHVLAANRDPRAAAALDAGAYRRVVALLSVHFGVILLDCGTGLLTDAGRSAVEMADQLVIVASASADAAAIGYRTIEWLEERGFERKVRQAVAVINTLDGNRRLDLGAVEAAFRRRCRTVVRVPRDSTLRLGARIDPDALRRRTRRAYCRLGVELARGFRASQ
jgi:MinD-like ATPase involved in chromosome partitioning or flagellar assembly